MAEFCPHQNKKEFIYLFIYLFNIKILFYFFQKKITVTNPLLLGGKKKRVGYIFSTHFSVLVFCQFPYSLERFVFNFLKPTFGSWYEIKGII